MKNIIVCCDGTGNEYGTNNTNVVAACELAQQSERQCRYYDPGVGTGGWVYEEDRGSLRAAMDQATGHGLRKNVEDAYRFLMQVYEDDNRVFLFGFSRGAFTVRSLAGMLHRCGLLHPTAANLVEYASKRYHQNGSGRDDAEVDAGFRATFARSCPVHFIGGYRRVAAPQRGAQGARHEADPGDHPRLPRCGHRRAPTRLSAVSLGLARLRQLGEDSVDFHFFPRPK